jgi:hypothetical protein
MGFLRVGAVQGGHDVVGCRFEFTRRSFIEGIGMQKIPSYAGPYADDMQTALDISRLVRCSADFRLPASGFRSRPCGSHPIDLLKKPSFSRTGNYATRDLRAGSARGKTARGSRWKSVNNIMQVVVGRVCAAVRRVNRRGGRAQIRRRTRDYPRGSSCRGFLHAAGRADGISLLARNPASFQRTAPQVRPAGSWPGAGGAAPSAIPDPQDSNPTRRRFS